ncbi:hypothetical protein RB653_007857 [Dictyostelium firmibasis]|uniref:Uncharacterized protein n=1 Tax=Dictyostelium firmibasis TaxID=79012 RepID=A0AAN7TWB8_9MYCE
MNNKDNLISQQQICLELINKLKEGVKEKYENNQVDKDYLMEMMFQLKEQHSKLEELIEDQHWRPIKEMIEKINKSNNKLESFKYEKIMLESEINDLRQLQFDLSNPSLGITPLEKFLSFQPSQYIESFDLKPKEKQSIERLEWEIYQRELKLIELENLKKLRIKLKQEDEKANNQLKQFEDKLKENLNVKKAVEPFQKFIGILPISKYKLNNIGNNPLLLESSQPLYILYHELIYFKEFFFNENLTVDFFKSNNEDMNIDNKNNCINKSTKLINPSKVFISLKIKKNEKELLIEFYYYPNLKIVTVLPSLNGNFEMGQKLLEGLDNSDTGLMTPNLSNHFIFESFGKDLFKLDEHNLKGRPYKWVQFITGLSFLPEITPENMKDKNFQLHDFQPKTSHKILFDIINSL